MHNLMFLISHFSGSKLALAGVAEPNKSVKGTRRPLAVLKFCFLSRSGTSLGFRWRRAPYRNVRRRQNQRAWVAPSGNGKVIPFSTADLIRSA